MERSNELSMDQAFLQKLTDSVLDNLSDEQFGAQELASDIGMSRSQIHRKLQKIIGKPITQFIREIRLKEAHRRLENKIGTASEIAYSVGFTSPAYFTKCFHDFYGYTPGEVNHQKVRVQRKPLLNKRIIPFGSAALLIVILFSLWYFTDKNRLISHASKDLLHEKAVIGILPFENQSNDSNQEFFAEGIAENIRDKLSRLSDLRVISMTSTKKYKSQFVSAKQIGKELDSDYLLEGSVFKTDNKIRLSVRLVECKSGLIRWSEPYERELSDILNLQNEIARNVTRKLHINLTDKEYLTLIELKDINPEIYTDYLYADFLKEEYEEKNDSSYNYKAIQLLNQIIKTEPLFTEAYVNLAWNLWYTRYYNRQLFESIGIDSIPNLIQRAIDLNPEYPDSYFFLSSFYHWKNDFSEEKKNLIKVIELDPNHYESMFDLANVFLLERDFENAFKRFFTTIRLKPINIHSDEVDLEWVEIVSYYLGQMYMYKESELILRKIIELNSKEACDLNSVYLRLAELCEWQGNRKEYLHWTLEKYRCDTTNWGALNRLGEAYVVIGDYEKGIYYYNLSVSQGCKCVGSDSSWFYPHRAYAYQQLGENEKASHILKLFLETAKNHDFGTNYWKTSNIAEAYALLGENEKALELLKSMPYDAFHFIRHNKLLYKLKDEKEYQEILHMAKAEEERVRDFAQSPKVQREVRRLLDRLEIVSHQTKANQIRQELSHSFE